MGNTSAISRQVRDLIDTHDPDLLYFDNSGLPLGWAGMNIGAYFYNHYLRTHNGALDAVLNIKQVPDNFAKAVVAVTSAASRITSCRTHGNPKRASANGITTGRSSQTTGT